MIVNINFYGYHKLEEGINLIEKIKTKLKLKRFFPKKKKQKLLPLPRPCITRSTVEAGTLNKKKEVIKNIKLFFYQIPRLGWA